MAEACRQMAQQCLATETDRVLVQANGCHPEGHLPLRNALTTMLLDLVVRTARAERQEA